MELQSCSPLLLILCPLESGICLCLSPVEEQRQHCGLESPEMEAGLEPLSCLAGKPEGLKWCRRAPHREKTFTKKVKIFRVWIFRICKEWISPYPLCHLPAQHGIEWLRAQAFVWSSWAVEAVFILDLQHQKHLSRQWQCIRALMTLKTESTNMSRSLWNPYYFYLERNMLQEAVNQHT